MEVETLLRRLVVVGNDDERGVGAGFLGMARIFEGLGRTVRSGAGDYRHPAGRRLDGQFDDAPVFSFRQGR